MKRQFQLTAVLFLMVSFARGQTVDISILKFKNEYKGDEPIWYANNKDSLFYKADTVTFTANLYNCCDCFNMKIRKNKILGIHESHLCVEPPTAMMRSDITKGKIKKKSGSYFLYIFKWGEIWKAYKIIELTKKSYFDDKNYPRTCFSMRLLKK